MKSSANRLARRGANGFPVATLSEAQRLLACATTIGEIQKVESLAQLAVEFAKRARLGRAAINAAAESPWMLAARPETP